MFESLLLALIYLLVSLLTACGSDTATTDIRYSHEIPSDKDSMFQELKQEQPEKLSSSEPVSYIASLQDQDLACAEIKDEKGFSGFPDGLELREEKGFICNDFEDRVLNICEDKFVRIFILNDALSCS